MEHFYWLGPDESYSLDEMKEALVVVVDAWIIYTEIEVPIQGDYLASGTLVHDGDGKHCVPEDNHQFDERLTEWANNAIVTLVSGTDNNETWGDLDIYRLPPPDEDEDKGGDDGGLFRLLYEQAVGRFAQCPDDELTMLAADGRLMVEELASEAQRRTREHENPQP